MNTENNSVIDDNVSLPKSVEVDEIIEFYKDKENDTAETAEDVAKSKKTPLSSLISFINKKTQINSEDIQSEVYGLSEKGRIVLYRIIAGVISVCVISGAFVLAYFLPGNDAVIAEQQEELRSKKSYVSLKSRYETLKTEVENLKTSNSEKKEQISQISDIDNTKAELRTQITAKTYELNELNSQIEEKRKAIDELDSAIAEKTPPETTLPPGKYVVGKNIAAGMYHVTGTGKFMVASAAGKSKLNTTLGSTPLEITLEQNDIIKFDSKVKFTSVN